MTNNTNNNAPVRVTSASDLLARYAAGGRDFHGADLRDADLRGANLRGATLSGATLSDADLRPIRADIETILAAAPGEVAGLLAALEAGRIDGRVYDGDCACLVGTIAHLRHEDVDHLTCPIIPDSQRPAERWFLAITPGDTPENNPVAAITAGWLRDWLANHPVPAS